MLATIMPLLPAEIRDIVARLPDAVRSGLDEIRIRSGRPLEIGHARGAGFATAAGGLTDDPLSAYAPGDEVCRLLLERLTNHSLYAMEEELRRGYITVPGGHRVGLAGRTVLERGSVRGIRDIGGFNIRIAREVRGAGDAILPRLVNATGCMLHPTLVVAPPQQGKTTLVRDLARSVSAGRWPSRRGGIGHGRKVGIVDERSEIAACVRGVPSFDVGPRTDVLDACPKAEGMMMMLRSLSPELLVVDEIGRPEDTEAILEAAHAGVAVLATAHAAGLSDARGRPQLRKLLDAGAFARCVELRRTSDGLSGKVLAIGEHEAHFGRDPSPYAGKTLVEVPGRGGSP